MRQNNFLPGIVDEGELLPDLDWMLESGQAGDGPLARALVGDYFPDLYSLVFAVQHDPQAAAHASLETVVAALLNVYRYAGRPGARGWLYHLALDIVRRESRRPISPFFHNRVPATIHPSPVDARDASLWAVFDALDKDARLTLLLACVHSLPPAEIAAVLNTGEAQVCARIESACRALQPAAGSGPLPLDDLFAALKSSLARRWPVPDFSAQDLDMLAAEAAAQAAHRRSRGLRLNSLWEVGLVGVIILAVFLLVRRADLAASAPNPTPPPRVVKQTVVVTRPAPAMLTPTPQRIPYPRVSAGDELTYVVRPGDTVESIAGLLGVPADELRQRNLLQPGDNLIDGRNLSFQVPAGYNLTFTPTAVPPVPWIEPLDSNSSTADILERMRASRGLWDTVWLDAFFLDYGPSGYIGPARGSHIQVWYSQPQQSLQVVGGLDGGPDWAILALPYETYHLDLPDGGLTSYSLGSGVRLIPTLDSMLFPEQSPWVGEGAVFRIHNYDRLAGRSALRVDWFDALGTLAYRLWLDRLTGIILRQQKLGGPGQSIILSDYLVLGFELNADFPPDSFDLQRIGASGFAADSSGSPIEDPGPSIRKGRVPLPYTFVSPILDDPLHRLTFQYPTNFDTDDPRLTVDLFGGGFYLGKAEFGNPFTMICDRSSDGRRIAFVSQPYDDPATDSSLNWFDLTEPLRPLHSLEDITVTRLAFSPDSRHLAAFGRYSSLSAIYIVDTDTAETQRLMTLSNARSLAWSPDGRFLALIGAYRSQPDEESLIVLEPSTGETVYSIPLGSESSLLPSDWPGAFWGIQFPIEQGGLEACSEIP